MLKQVAGLDGLGTPMVRLSHGWDPQRGRLVEGSILPQRNYIIVP